ncbi:hypothetical protein L6164_023048 [Bauhinia variegata]|uniref:Uncharacterized protein n=1 Tax=Bauhinia variegata TaxID=167791 RepID=A0ACB9MGY9_BAUVA|nr:hypothetical protein L6164_023048 [Bauhinia variegata]
MFLVRTPKTPIELGIDFILHDFEMAEVEPISTYVDFGEREFWLRMKEDTTICYTKWQKISCLLMKVESWTVASNLTRFSRLDSSESHISLYFIVLKVVREIQHTRSGVAVITEDGCLYEANYVILSVSIGVLQSDLIAFNPPLPVRFILFSLFFFTPAPTPQEPRTQKHCRSLLSNRVTQIYYHERRGYYTFWQDMDSAYPGSNILVVTLTNGESKRVEAQSDEETLKEAMGVLRDMFGPNIPDATGILVPRWWNNRFQRGSYSNYPIVSNLQVVHDIKAPIGRIFLTGEHTSAKFNGYVHGGYLSGIDTSKALPE